MRFKEANTIFFLILALSLVIETRHLKRNNGRILNHEEKKGNNQNERRIIEIGLERRNISEDSRIEFINLLSKMNAAITNKQMFLQYSKKDSKWIAEKQKMNTNQSSIFLEGLSKIRSRKFSSSKADPLIESIHEETTAGMIRVYLSNVHNNKVRLKFSFPFFVIRNQFFL